MPKTSLKPVSNNGITALAFNKDRTMVALCPNTNEVHIYATNGSINSPKWDSKPRYVLDEHTEIVVGIDWHPETNQIVTCAHDRNAYVWNHVAEQRVVREGKESKEAVDKWEHTLVILRINRAATAVKWCPAGNKFAVTSASKSIPVCYYNQDSNWWVCPEKIRKHKSTVVALDWCPNNKMIVSGSTDYKCRILSAYYKHLDAKEGDGFEEIFPKINTFGEVLAEFSQAKAWVQSVAWSPSMYRIAFTGHGSTIHMVQLCADGKPSVQTIRASGLPYVAVEFLSNKCIVAAGYDQNPHIYLASDANGAEPTWKFEAKVDKEKKAEKKKEERLRQSSRHVRICVP